MEERQYAEDCVPVGDLDDGEGRLTLRQKVGVRQDDAFGIGSGAGGVKD
jgi:hypothetical protein